MTSVLDVTDSVSRQPSGTMKIIYWETGGAIMQNWEWVGGPDASDGGTWVWRVSYFKGTRMPYMELTSNLSRGVIGQVASEKWVGNSAPPPQPWFPNGRHEDAGLLYFSASGLKRPFDWDAE
jgi:hypothetical protein